MGLLAGAALALVCLVVLALPFRRARSSLARTEWDALEMVQARREAIYEEIRTLKLDYALANVGEEEYQTRLRAYRLRAAAVLREQERLEHRLLNLDQALEERVLALRQFRSPAEALRFCPTCGQHLDAGTEVCPDCGADPPDPSGTSTS
ncbi:MAG: zinc ribbon domain-containing protein [Dehalococcoidia bacterium]